MELWHLKDNEWKYALCYTKKKERKKYKEASLIKRKVEHFSSIMCISMFKCYSSKGKGILVLGSQVMPTCLFWWGMVSLQEYSNPVPLWERHYSSAPVHSAKGVSQRDVVVVSCSKQVVTLCPTPFRWKKVFTQPSFKRFIGR